jgi:uracil-DNA glycosylase
VNRLREPLPALLDRVPGGWRAVVDAWRASPAGRALLRHVEDRRAAGAAIYPARVLHALELTPIDAVRVVILGQDPYHGAGQAEGLAFSVPPGCPLPPSLRNIYRELTRDLGVPAPANGCLERWARQGVLLLNTSLTVEEGLPGSHARRGWEALTDAIIEAVAGEPAPKVFMLWGAHAQAKRGLVRRHDARHLLLESNHPSPLSARRPPVPFVGCGHFSAANRFLADHGRGPVDWGGK